jgi:ketosteroid isomerase-like protein
VSTPADNKDVVRRFLGAIPGRDLDTMADCLTEDIVQHYQQPSARADAGTLGTADLHGRDAMLEEIRDNLYDIYRQGTIEVQIQQLIADGDFVCAQFIQRAITAQRGEPYENWYCFVYRFENGRIAEYWQYLDNVYATKLLFPD